MFVCDLHKIKPTRIPAYMGSWTLLSQTEGKKHKMTAGKKRTSFKPRCGPWQTVHASADGPIHRHIKPALNGVSGYLKESHMSSIRNSCLEIGEEINGRKWECVGNEQIVG